MAEIWVRIRHVCVHLDSLCPSHSAKLRVYEKYTKDLAAASFKPRPSSLQVSAGEAPLLDSAASQSDPRLQ